MMRCMSLETAKTVGRRAVGGDDSSDDLMANEVAKKSR